jgi:FkbM family methyltransferase
MSLVRLGSDYGGWWVDPDAVPDGSVVIDAGVGGDDSFARALLAVRRVTVLAVDPSEAARELYARGAPPGVVFLPRALTPGGGPVTMSRGDGCSDSALAEMPGMSRETYRAEGVGLPELLRGNNVALVKLDVEGMEFALLPQCLGVRQVCVEFHTAQMPHRRGEAEALVARFVGAGYRVAYRTDRDEVTFLKG